MDGGRDWFIVQNGQQMGPMSEAQLRAEAAAGRLSASDRVWTEGMADWQPASAIKGLIPAAARAAAPPPMPPSPTAYARPLPPPEDLGQHAGMRMLMPVGRSGWAIAAGYLGLLSVLLIFAPFAVVTAILAIRDIRRNPQRHGIGRAIFGLIMGLLGTAALGAMVVVLIADL